MGRTEPALYIFADIPTMKTVFLLLVCLLIAVLMTDGRKRPNKQAKQVKKAKSPVSKFAKYTAKNNGKSVLQTPRFLVELFISVQDKTALYVLLTV